MAAAPSPSTVAAAPYRPTASPPSHPPFLWLPSRTASPPGRPLSLSVFPPAATTTANSGEVGRHTAHPRAHLVTLFLLHRVDPTRPPSTRGPG
ncbi:unnamed protein product [Triticum turgidum subsp. durum]|uniref:Uncharacterized protein n=1 Tax=Triticum turgidum subsp. durum TaxID=4567 RepID=A0A9R0TG16_TRITD|nr:unnamed protein product [Triticum turgidum subsp. durum]